MKWTNDLSSGVEQIDDQHKELISRVNTLIDAMKLGRGKAEVGETVKFLSDYVATHFGAEEKYMADFCYPDLDEHRAEHKAFVGDFRDLVRGLNDRATGSYLSIQVQHRVCDWLANHICKTDKELGHYLRARL